MMRRKRSKISLLAGWFHYTPGKLTPRAPRIDRSTLLLANCSNRNSGKPCRFTPEPPFTTGIVSYRQSLLDNIIMAVASP